MSNDELKQAMLTNATVIYKNSEYRLTGIVYRAKNKKIIISAEITDKNKNSVVYALSKEIRCKE